MNTPHIHTASFSSARWNFTKTVNFHLRRRRFQWELPALLEVKRLVSRSRCSHPLIGCKYICACLSFATSREVTLQSVLPTYRTYVVARKKVNVIIWRRQSGTQCGFSFPIEGHCLLLQEKIHAARAAAGEKGETILASPNMLKLEHLGLRTS